MMTDFVSMNSFTRLIEIFNRKTTYDELIHEGGFSLPKKNRKELTPEIAQWTLDNVKNFNSGNPRLQEMINTCREYLELYALEAAIRSSLVLT